MDAKKEWIKVPKSIRFTVLMDGSKYIDPESVKKMIKFLASIKRK